MARQPLRSWLRARFDRTMDRGTPALVGWLGLASLVLVAVFSILVFVLAPGENDAQGNIFYIAWETLLRAMDPGTIGGDQHGSVVFLALMFVVTIGGIFIVSTLIGVLTTGMNARVEKLRMGRAPVIETGHVVILGWSDQVFIVVGELARANQGRKRSHVVILADRDKVDMEEQIRSRVSNLGRTQVICRHGSPLKRTDLDLVNLGAARSVIVLSPPGDDADINVIKMLLLLQHRAWPPNRPHVVAAIRRTENMAAARLAGGPHAQVVDADDIAVRLVVQSHRQAGLSTVCADLLNFDGNEIYMRAEPKLVGRTYADALQAYELGCPIGLCRADESVLLNPPSPTPIEPGDQIIVIAEDDLLVRLADRPTPIDTDAIRTEVGPAAMPDHTLMLGWNARAVRIIEMLDRLVAPGSTLDVACASPPDEIAVSPAVLRVGFKPCQPTSRRSLEQDLDLGSYRNIIVLADDTVDPDHADDRNLVTLLHLRDIEVGLGDPYSIITEMNDDLNREVAQVTRADDFIVSNKMISLLITQLAENKHLHKVFAELFDPSDSEIYLKPAGAYLRPDVPTNFATVVEAARRRGETAIGVRTRAGGDEAPGYGVTLNPPKGAPLRLTAEDNVIVVAAN